MQVAQGAAEALQRGVDVVEDAKHLRRVQRERVGEGQQRRAADTDALPREEQLVALAGGERAAEAGQVVHCARALLCLVDEVLEEVRVHAAYAWEPGHLGGRQRRR